MMLMLTCSTENVTNGNSGIRNITRILELKAGIIDSCLGNVLSWLKYVPTLISG